MPRSALPTSMCQCCAKILLEGTWVRERREYYVTYSIAQCPECAAFAHRRLVEPGSLADARCREDINAQLEPGNESGHAVGDSNRSAMGGKTAPPRLRALRLHTPIRVATGTAIQVVVALASGEAILRGIPKREPVLMGLGNQGRRINNDPAGGYRTRTDLPLFAP